MPGEISQRSLFLGRRPRLTSSIATFRARSSTRRPLIPRLRRWHRREPELVARLGGLFLVALIAQFNYYFVLELRRLPAPLHDPGRPRPLGHFGGHLPGDAAAGLAVRSSARAPGRRPTSSSSRSRSSSSSEWNDALLGWRSGRALRDDVAGRLSPPDRGLRPLVARQARLDHDRPGDGRLRLALRRRGHLTGEADKFLWNPSPDLQHPNIFLAGLLLTGYVVARQVKRILLLSQYYEHRQVN